MKKRSSKEILAGALLKLARQTPIEDITVKRIVEASGLSLQTFYNHFRDKDDLILWAHRSEGERLLARLAGQKYSLHDLTMDNIRFYTENAGYLRDRLVGEGFSLYAGITADHLFEFMRAYILRRSGMEELSEELAFYLRMYVYACMHVFTECSLRTDMLSPERLAYYLEQGMPEKLKPYLLD